jgi:hypothetical protein
LGNREGEIINWSILTRGYVGDSGDETPIIENVYPKSDPKSMAVKADTEADRERLWQSVLDYARG